TEMLMSHDVEKLVAYKQNDLYIVEVYIQKEKLQNEKYKDVSDANNGYFASSGPQYYFTQGSLEILNTKLEEAQKGFSPTERIDVQYVIRSKWGRDFLISWFLPLGLMILFWVFIMRRMSGGAGGGGGQIFNIGKSKATLFDKESQVTITF